MKRTGMNNNNTRLLLIGIFCCLSLALSACGGGGNNNGSIADSGSTTPNQPESNNSENSEAQEETQPEPEIESQPEPEPEAVTCREPCNFPLRINEIAAANTVIEDEDGDTPDWIELVNVSDQELSLSGWIISDDLEDSIKWSLPDVTLAANEYLLIWASNKDRYDYENKAFHTNFKISALGDNLYVFDDQGELTSTIKFHAIPEDFSLGNLAGEEQSAFFYNPTPGKENSHNGPSQPQSQPCMQPCNYTIRINEASTTNADFLDDDNESSDWIELYNFGENSISLNGWGLSDKLSKTRKWVFPNVILPADSYLIVWASDKDRYNLDQDIFHTNFKISSEGETLYLFDDNAQAVSSLRVRAIPGGHSAGIAHESSDVVIFDNPTPGIENSSNRLKAYIGNKLVFSHDGGIVADNQTVTLENIGAGQTVRYTTDATIPNESSTLYTGPINVESSAVLRARIFQNGFIPSPAFSRAYLLDGEHDIPVVSLITDPENFFDPETGIYAHDDSLSPWDPSNQNYYQREWERDIHFSFYDENKELGTEFDAGIKIHGGWTRRYEQRSLAIYARGQYGASEIDYPFYSDLDYQNFQALVLRNSGLDWRQSYFRDALVTTIARGTKLDTQATLAVAVYLNGEYWGLYNLREKSNEHFLASKEQVDADQIQLVEGDLSYFGEFISSGSLRSETVESWENFYALANYIFSNSLSDNDNYQHVESLMDVDNYIRYMAVQIYFDNRDMFNNLKYYKVDGGKWKWLVYDQDFSLSLGGPYGPNDTGDYTNDSLSVVLGEIEGFGGIRGYTLFLKKLVENEQFSRRFINYFADVLNTRFSAESVVAELNKFADTIRSEVPRTENRWANSTITAADWEAEIAKMRTWATERPTAMLTLLQTQFGLSGTQILSLHNHTTNGGSILLNNNLSISDEIWSGAYFKEVPVTLTAVPAEGFIFSHWMVNGNVVNNAELEVVLNDNPSDIEVVFSVSNE